MHHETHVAALDARIRALVRGEEDFDAVAGAVFEHQLAASAPYRALCARRGVTGPVSSWREVPAMPVEAFGQVDLRTFPVERTVATFRTSGTTRPDARGAHHFDDLSLYRLAAITAFRPALVPEGGRIRVISLIPGADAVPDSSLSRMVTWVIDELGAEGSLVDPSGESLLAIEPASERVLVIGTTIGLCAGFSRQPGPRLPPGTRIMETGGFKGQRRAISRSELHSLYHRAGVPSSHVVGEYGMTELSSQWYDGVAGLAPVSSPEARVYRPPPWARTRVLDPATLEDVEPGCVGLLMHVDPVNRGSVQAVLTGDMGRRVGDGFVYIGRAAGAGVRGCSLREDP